MGAIETLLNDIDTQIYGFVNAVFFQLSPTVRTLWRMMMVIFVALYGYRVFISGNFEARELFIKVIKLVIVLAIATEWANFSLLVYDMATKFPGEIGSQIVGTKGHDAESVNAGITNFFDRGFSLAGQLLNDAGWGNLLYFAYGLAAGAFTILFGGYATFLIILAKLAVAILLAVAPIFILLLIFNESRDLFMGWLRTLINYALVPLFVYTLLALIGAILDGRLEALENAVNTKTGITTALAAFALATFAGFLLSLQIMGITSGITGGYTLGTMGGVGAGISRSGRGISHSARGGVFATKTGYRASKWAVNHKYTRAGLSKAGEAAKSLGRILIRNRTGGST